MGNKIIYLLLVCVLFFIGCSDSHMMSKWKSTDETGYILLNEVIKAKDGTIAVDSGKLFYYVDYGTWHGFKNFEMSGFAKTEKGSTAGIWFHTSLGRSGYEVLIHNGPLDKTRKTGSLSAVRNLYKSMANDGEWFPFKITVRGNNIAVQINGRDVVCYTEPNFLYRLSDYALRRLGYGEGYFSLIGYQGKVEFKKLAYKKLSVYEVNPGDTLGAVDERTDPIIQYQQMNFPIIDFHVHLKGWTMEQAHATSMNYGINYGIAPNCGPGFHITDDEGVRLYVDSTKHLPFFFGMQCEGRQWVTTFSRESRHLFDYGFADALTFNDHKGRPTRMWIPEESFVDIPAEQYVDMVVDRTLYILNNEPIDIYVNPTLLPHVIRDDYEKLWTKERYDKIIKALKDNGIALEINARYKIPSFEIIKAAKEAGVKFTFGTNNNTPEMGKLEYCLEAIRVCRLTEDDLWFPIDRKPF